MWDLFQTSGIPQYYALYAALKYEEEEKKKERSQTDPRRR